MRMANFFWGFQEQQARMHYLSWDNLCQSFQNGGLQFHHLEYFNIAMLGKHLWRIIQDEHSMTSRILSQKYLIDGVKSHIGWGGERKVLYIGLDTSPSRRVLKP